VKGFESTKRRVHPVSLLPRGFPSRRSGRDCVRGSLQRRQVDSPQPSSRPAQAGTNEPDSGTDSGCQLLPDRWRSLLCRPPGLWVRKGRISREAGLGAVGGAVLSPSAATDPGRASRRLQGGRYAPGRAGFRVSLVTGGADHRRCNEGRSNQEVAAKASYGEYSDGPDPAARSRSCSRFWTNGGRP